jgi:hypothetical protein
LRRIAIADGDAFGKIEGIVEAEFGAPAGVLMVTDNYLGGGAL